MNNQELWQSVLAQVQLNISPANFATWFKDTEIISCKKEKVMVAVPNSFVKEWLETKYNKLIFKTLHDLDIKIKDVKYVVGAQNNKAVEKIPAELPKAGQLEFQEFQVDKKTNLNPRYKFGNFIVGSFNELAQAAAWAVAKNPGALYNPFFVYGGVGLGKTHLLQAVGNEIVRKFSTKNIKYITAEKFTSEVVSSIKNHIMEKFKAKYRAVDILIIDDVQFWTGKEKTQEEFFHTFNSLYEKNKQIILSSDRPPKAIPSIAERLRSRFEGGMIADIGYPDLETRIAILKVKTQERKIKIPEEVLEFVATHIKNNIRELEGALNRLVVYQKLNERMLDFETSKTLLKNIICPPAKFVSQKKIIQKVAEFYEVSEKDIFSSSRRKEIVRPRQIAMYLLRKEINCSYPSIGRRFGGKDHTTAIYAYEKILKNLEKNEKLKEEIELIKQTIYS